ncbi:hypothetical protein ACW9H6_28810, partial [Pseudomonas sp. SDO528_S397]
RLTPRLNIGLRPAWFNGALKIKIKSRSRSKAGGLAADLEAWSLVLYFLHLSLVLLHSQTCGKSLTTTADE